MNIYEVKLCSHMSFVHKAVNTIICDETKHEHGGIPNVTYWQ